MWLRVVSGVDAGRTVEVAPGRPFVLGRVQGCDLVIRDERASRQHAELMVDAGGALVVRDLGSANGTFVDGRRVDEARLEGGEQLEIAGVEIAVLVRAPGEREASAPTWSMVGRLVDQRTRGARRATYVALGAAALALAAAAILLARGGDDDDGEVPAVVRAVAPSTVLVEALRGGRRNATGSGWVLDARRGWVVTAAHVVNEGTTYRVAADGQVRPAQLVANAPCEDLALLSVSGATGLRDTVLAESEAAQGETVVALGYQSNAAPTDGVTTTRGVVSAAHTAFRDPAADVPAYPDVVQTDTALNPGNSGGPLVDLDGRLVGVNAAARTTGSDGRPLEGQNFAIAADHARSVLADLRLEGSIGWLGVTFGYPTTEELAERKLPAGLYLTGAVPGTPAARAGLGRGGDLLAGVDGRRIQSTLDSFCDAIAGRRSGERVRLTLVRPGSGRVRDVTVPLA